MKKSTLILIAIVYVASIVIISVFGMKSVVYNAVIPVKSIICLNETDDKAIVKDLGEKKRIDIEFGDPGEISNEGKPKGTMLQLKWRVLPDNATNKTIKLVYDVDVFPNVIAVKDDNGNDLGLLLFTSKVVLPLKITSTDGTIVYTEVLIWVK